MHAPTLLVFTLGAARESARRRLLPPGLGGLELGLWESCLHAALEAGKALGCRLEVSSPSGLALPAGILNVPQEGTDFGSRLEGAMLDAFERGPGPLLVVGTDVPELGSRHLGQALALLKDDPDQVVLGPSPDGGLYLLAASRPIPGLARTVRWCRRDTLRSLLEVLRAQGRPVTLLDPLADLDKPAHLERWLIRAGERWRGLAGLLRAALAALRRPWAEPAAAPAFVPYARRTGRSPPASVSF